MVFMIFINLLYLLRKIEEGLGLHLDLVHTPNLAHPLLYSKNHAEKDTKKSEKRSNKKCFFLDKCDSSCYNKDITIRNQQPFAALPVNYCQTMPIVHTDKEKTWKDLEPRAC